MNKKYSNHLNLKKINYVQNLLDNHGGTTAVYKTIFSLTTFNQLKVVFSVSKKQGIHCTGIMGSTICYMLNKFLV